MTDGQGKNTRKGTINMNQTHSQTHSHELPILNGANTFYRFELEKIHAHCTWL